MFKDKLKKIANYEEKSQEGNDKKKIENYCELQSFFYTVILFRLIVKGGNGLKALADSESNTHQEHGITIHNAHGGDGSVSKGLGQIIQNTMGDGVQALTDKGREANTQNLENAVGTFCNIRKPDLTLSHSEKENHQENKTEYLRYRSCQTSSVDAHL